MERVPQASGLHSKRISERCFSASQGFLLRVQAILHVGSPGAVQGEACAGGASQHAGVQRHPQGGVAKNHIESIVYQRSPALRQYIRAKGLRRSKKQNRLIDEMGSQVKEQATAGFRLLAPGGRRGSGR